MSFLVAENISLQFGGLKAVDECQLRGGEGRDIHDHRSERRRQDLDLQSDLAPLQSDVRARFFFDGEEFTNAPPHRIAKMGIARTFQNIELFDNATRAEQPAGRPALPRDHQPCFRRSLFLPAVKRAEFEHRHKVEQVIELLDLEPIATS